MKKNEEKKCYIIFADEICGGHGYLIGDSYEELKREINGEKHIEERVYGYFLAEKIKEAEKLLEEISRVLYTLCPDDEKIKTLEAL